MRTEKQIQMRISRVKHYLSEFEEAHHDYAFIGNKMPEEHKEIELEYVRTKENLLRYIEAKFREA